MQHWPQTVNQRSQVFGLVGIKSTTEEGHVMANNNTIKNESAQVGTDSLYTHPNDKREKPENQAEYSLVTLKDLVEMRLPPRQWVAYPLIQEKSLTMIYAPRGIGKTYVAMTIALGVAGGVNVFGLKIEQARTVVYIDGEMAASDFSDRMQSLFFGLGLSSYTIMTNLHILSNDLQPRVLPNLGTSAGQKQISKLLQDADLIILDNLSALYSYGRENEAESWTPMQQWLLELKHAGKSVLVIDHSGKNQDNRGTSKKQDIMDAIVALSKPESYKAMDGAHFVLSYQKSRNVCGEDISPKEYQLRSDESTGNLHWDILTTTRSDITQEEERQRAQELKGQGMSVREIATAMGIGKTKAAELVKAPSCFEPKTEPEEQPAESDDENVKYIDSLDELDDYCDF